MPARVCCWHHCLSGKLVKPLAATVSSTHDCCTVGPRLWAATCDWELCSHVLLYDRSVIGDRHRQNDIYFLQIQVSQRNWLCAAQYTHSCPPSYTCQCLYRLIVSYYYSILLQYPAVHNIFLCMYYIALHLLYLVISECNGEYSSSKHHTSCF